MQLCDFLLNASLVLQGNRLRLKACRERKLRDARCLEERIFLLWERNNPRPRREEWVLPVAEVDFASWVKVLKLQPRTSEMLVGRQDFSFAHGSLRTIDESFRRLSRLDTRYCCLYYGRDGRSVCVVIA